ncbi:hypothetical protein BGW42_003858 [Actinomortierella wolfii]|nr:hypothetical protein BGW42_003858 [Actinomortierella wolfii]
MKPIILLASLALAVVASAAGTTYLEETFSDDKWAERWTLSESRSDLGKVEVTAGSLVADEEYSKGLQTVEDHRFYQLTTPLKETVDNSKEDLIIQYTVRQDRPQECGGSYLKLLPEGYDPKTFHGDSEYNIMFGPDLCGSENRLHVIFNYKGKNYLSRKQRPTPKDRKTHLYRLIVHPDQKYSLQVDNELVEDKTPMEGNWDMFKPRKIDDPEDKKPEDWVDEKMIPDPEAKKPEGYDDIPRFIPDPEAKQPEDWDTEADGDWVPPTIPNPEFEEWIPKMIKNPAYKGEWTPRQIDNPEFEELPDLAHYKSAGVGFDLWQVKGGSIFDDIIVTTDREVADKYLENWKANSKKEEKILEEQKAKAAKEEEERKKKEEEEKKKEEEAKKEQEEKKEHDELDELDEEVVENTKTEDKKEDVKEEEVKKEEVKKEEVKEEEVKKEEEEPKKEEAKEETEKKADEPAPVVEEAVKEETSRHDEL